jgi:hypothetical protein
MILSTHRRTLAVGTFAILGSALAFLIGASTGQVLNHRVNTLSVARVPTSVLAAQAHAAPGLAVAQR